MVRTITSNSMTNEDFEQKAQDLGQQQFALEEATKKNAPTMLDKMDAALTDNVTGYTTVKEYITNMQPSNDVQDFGFYDDSQRNVGKTEFNMDEATSILNNSKIPAEDWKDLTNTKTMEDFYQNIGRYSNKKEAEKLLQNLPMSEQLLYNLGASALDPVSWATGAGIGKVFSTVNLAAKFTGSSALALKALENSATVAGGVGLSEALLQSENSVNEQDRLLYTMGASAVLGAGVSLLPSVIKGSSTLTSQAVQATGVNKALQPMSDFVRSHLVLNPLDQILNSKTAPQWVKDMAGKADVPVFSYKDASGNVITRSSDNALGYKRGFEGYLLEAASDVRKRAIAEGKQIHVKDAEDMADWRVFENKVQDEVDRIYMTKSEQELNTIYETSTGTLIPTKKGKPVIPEDYYQVITNTFKRELESNTPPHLQVPSHLQYIHDFYKKFADEGTTIGQQGLAGKSSFGYATRGYDVDKILMDTKPVAVGKFEEMLKANKLFQKELLTSKGAKKQQLLDDVKDTAEYMYQKALDSYNGARYLDTSATSSRGARATQMRTYRLDTSLYPEYFSKSILGDMVSYTDSMGGRMALKKYYNLSTSTGTTLQENINKVYEKMVAEGASRTDVQNFKAIIETVAGTRKIQSDPHSFSNLLSRLGKKYATAQYGAGFSIYSLAEVGSIIAKNGLANTIKEFIPAHKHLVNMLSGTTANDPMVKYFNDVGLAGMVIRDMKNNRFETNELVHRMGAVERGLDTIGAWGRKISFFNHIQDVLDFAAGGSYLSDLRTVSKKLNDGGTLTKGELSKFSRYGLSEADIKAFNNVPEIQYHPKSDVVKDYDFYNWSDQALSKKILQSMRNSVTDTIIRTDGTRVHRWQSEVNDPVKSMLLQYTQFPAAAYERLTLAMGENPARMVAGAMAAMAISYTMMDLQDTALVKLGVKDVKMSPEDLAAKAFLKTQFSTIFPSLWDMVATPLGMATTSGYQSSKPELPQAAAATTIDKTLKSLHDIAGAVADGDYNKVLSSVSANTPILNVLPFIKAGFKAITGQQVTERGLGSMKGTHSSDYLLERIQDTAQYKAMEIK